MHLGRAVQLAIAAVLVASEHSNSASGTSVPSEDARLRQSLMLNISADVTGDEGRWLMMKPNLATTSSSSKGQEEYNELMAELGKMKAHKSIADLLEQGRFQTWYAKIGEHLRFHPRSGPFDNKHTNFLMSEITNDELKWLLDNWSRVKDTFPDASIENLRSIGKRKISVSRSFTSQELRCKYLR